MKKFNKILALCLALVLVVGAFAACGNKPQEDKPTEKPMKVGFIFLHDENSTYDRNFIVAAEEATKKLGAEMVVKKNIPESNKCYEAAAELVDAGCEIVFADSFGHEDFMIKAAKEFTDVQFCHATGTKAHTAKVPNFHNAFASIYEGRYLAGIAAGMKLNEMIKAGDFKAEDAKMGYVGAFPYAEVKSGYTSFFLGAKSVCPSVTMDVQFTGSWYDEALEKEAANALINRNCKLISQHADSMGAPSACENAKVPNVSYNGSTLDACPNTFIVSSRINWAPYFEYIINCVKEKKDIDVDWTGTIATESVLLTDINDKVAAEGTKEAIEKAKAGLKDGSIKVFDTKNFTVDGKEVAKFMADVDSDAEFKGDTEAIVEGEFAESKFRSAPYFTLDIDGITLVN